MEMQYATFTTFVMVALTMSCIISIMDIQYCHTNVLWIVFHLKDLQQASMPLYSSMSFPSWNR
jgi:hypothetical protein